MGLSIMVADDSHLHHSHFICQLIVEAAAVRGTGIAKRTPEYLQKKMIEGKAIIALDNNEPVGFCYIETWGHGKYVANSGLIVAPEYRKTGLAHRIKTEAFNLSRQLYPESKLFGITTSLPVMKINSDLGYKPVTFSELTDDDAFWKGCEGCVNHDILMRHEHKMCLCTGMLFDPTLQQGSNGKEKRWSRFKQFIKHRKSRLSQIIKSFTKSQSDVK